eukprot:Gregarina_sp_Pseudo_9__1332@NODE_1893_length_1271_cov_91_728084_g1756_i0_p1_GENE_NODE_1893_length_1271_cov_91_728084_g1756_i0NODE_1893_length_1271_cov_91_728084_g1756_i0_p1_ORF_typecomplete_len334_score44_63ANAPC4_WD40/PF12894_7/1_6e05ANAPC4_WD40/PF12894_7/0_41ANAPC4_WD40/PF12894_7/3_5e05ANAPC4_WD40/PF12894_7/0_0011WD40/PF00400_32/1_3WD40/PF00400_32/1_7WD40/PF00400_32/1_4WD40/PF00400_32/0_0005WD40/PF00400_32/3_4e02WD40/PF00400_32/1_4e03Ge1_WD40/PF16529_5/9_2e05Ge1_WD40/PF16529_5/4_9e02Ge1_WD40/P
MLSSVHPLAIGGSKSFVDIKYDPSGQELATTSTEGSVYFWQTNEEALAQQQSLQQSLQPIAALRNLDGPIWKIAFAPSTFGRVCATGGFNRKVIIWKDCGNGNWQSVHCDESHHSAITGLEFCASPGAPLSQYQSVALPQNSHMGLHLASSSLDGSVNVSSLTNMGTWVSKAFVAHCGGVRALAWSTAESAATTSNFAEGEQMLAPQHRLATGGVDGVVKVWRYEPTRDEWQPSGQMQVRSPVVSLAWQPANENQKDFVAVLTDDGGVALWEKEERGDVWREVKRFGRLSAGASKISWSVDGLLLAIPTADPQHVWMIRENSENRQWEVCTSD